MTKETRTGKRFYDARIAAERKIRRELQAHLESVTTKFEITMTIEVVDVGGVAASPEALRDSIVTEVEGISSGNVVKVKSIMVTGKI